jgi:hypothetical protein
MSSCLSSKTYVCQVKLFNALDKLDMIWWVKPDISPSLPDTYEIHPWCKELLEECIVYATHLDDVLDGAHVFHANRLESVWTDCTGTFSI